MEATHATQRRQAPDPGSSPAETPARSGRLLGGKRTGPIVFRLKRTRKASHTYPLKLTQQQRETRLEHTHLTGKLKKKIEQAEDGTQVVPVTWNDLHKLNDETGQAALYARSPHKKRLTGNAALKTRSSTGLNARSREGDRLLPPLRFLRKIQLC